MIDSLLIAIGGIITLMIGWAVVQSLWGKTFAEYMEEEDALAGRTKCGNCGCTTACGKNVDPT